jgi:hypothetical protein
LCLLPALAWGEGLFSGGHTKARLHGSSYPSDSLFGEFSDDPAFDQGADLRLKFAHNSSAWRAEAHYQLMGQFGDSLEVAREFPTVYGVSEVLPDDDQRLLDLSHDISDNDDRAVSQRLDRLYAEYRSSHWVGRIGRQAVSWGNGLIYTPMDFFNPFDPSAVDTEYKTGDDMLYGQYLRDNGDDFQLVWVGRRDEDENIDADVNSTALKYHGFLGDREYDLLLAEHYSDLIVGLGGNMPLGGAILRGDLTVTDAEDTTLSAVASLSWSWLGWGKNMSGVVEYFYNGFGQDDDEYSPQDLLDNTDLIDRLQRGELFTIGKHYLAGSLLVEVTPLLTLTPNLFLNLEDGSFLGQLVGQYSVSQNWNLLLSLNVPVGSSDTEYGGIESGFEDFELSFGPSIFTQLAWYF